MAFVQKKVKVLNSNGLHGRPAAKIVEAVKQFEAIVFFHKDGETYDAGSILELLSMACSKGTTIMIEACGDDAEIAAAALETLIINRFYEE